MATSIDFLLEKIDGQKLSADEFKALVRAVKENQDIAAKVPEKFGYALKVSVAGRNTLHFFTDKSAADSWEANPSEENAPLATVPLPSDGGEAYSYVVKLETNSAQEMEGASRRMSVNIRFTSVVYNSLDQSVSDTGEDAQVRIQRQMEGGSGWTTVGILDSFASVAANTGAYTTIDLTDYLANGSQTLRFIATGSVSGLSTTFLTFNVHVAEMDAAFTTNWGEAFVYNDDVALTHSMVIPLRITGNVHKILYWELLDGNGTEKGSGSMEIGTAEYTETSFQGLSIAHPQETGIFTVRARLRYGNTGVYTEWIEQDIMLSVSGDDTVVLCVNNVTNPVYNWSSQHLLDYAVYNPNTITTSEVSFELTDSTGETLWMTGTNSNAENGTVYDYTPYLGIENNSASGRVRLFAARLVVKVGGVAMKTITYSVDNSNDFAPTPGASFKMMPSSRSNSDPDRESVRNESGAAGEPASLQGVWENVMFESDGWVAEGGVKMLRLFAGGGLTIPYECYSATSQVNGLTIEADIRVRNVGDEDEPVLRIGKESDGQFIGLVLYPKRGYFFKNVNNVDWFQDVEWQEDRRTHLAVNIIPGLSVGGRGINLVRIFVNGRINREFTFEGTDRFWDGTGSGGIRIGSAAADIDVFGLAVFKEKKLSSADVLNDYVASLSDVDEKLAIIEANNIMEGGVIKYALAKDRYNTLVWKGIYPSKLNQVETTGDLEVSIIGAAAHSGTLYGMKCKGQGTSSKRYLKWNGGWSFGENGNWVDGSGSSKGKYYRLTATSPKAKKLVGKLNWASSPQAHKMGMCDMFNVLHDAVFDGSAGYEKPGIKTLEGYENTKVAVEEKAFLFFVQETPDSEPVFYGNMTWGSAKGDAPTFGYDKEHPVLKDYLMIEGSDQTPKLTLCQVPWFDDEVTYNGEEEYYEYDGMGSFDVTLGNRASITHFRDAFNQCFRYSTRIMYYNGRLEDLQSDESADKSFQHFIVGQTYDNFYLYRYDWLAGRWVNAGITKTNGVPDAVYLPDELGITLDPASADFDGMLATVKAARIAAFRAIAGNHFHVNDMLFCMQFNKINALSDNRAKNTYPYYDPVERLIRNASDDNDTCLPFNNQGQKQKPSWVEEHDFDSRLTFNNYYWAASGNAMYNLFEDAYPAELRSMMRRMMTAMANLGVGYGEGGVMGFYDKYFFSIHRYFPAVAYNECARLWYEYAKTLYDSGEYTNDTDPITQSLGDQLECEKEWVRKRIVYMASYCMYNAALGGSIEFRQQSSATYALRPSRRMYIYMQLGTSYRYPVGFNVPKRCEAGETVEIVCEGSDSIQTYIVGAEYLSDLGDLSRVGVTGSTAFANGRRLARLKLGDANAAVVKFKPSSVVSFPANAAVIDLRNIGDGLTSIGSLADVTKLREFYAEGTGLTAVVFPQTGNLGTVSLPEGLQSLVLRNQMGIGTFSFTPSSLRTLVSGNCNVIDQAFIEGWLDGIGNDLSGYSLEIDGVRWTGFAASRLMKMVRMGHIIIKGRITLDGNSIGADQLTEVYSVLGSLMDSGELELVYGNVITLSITNMSITGGDESSVSSFTCSSLDSSPLSLVYSEDGETWLPMSENPLLTMTSRTEVVNGCRYLHGTLYAEDEVTVPVQYRVRATDGEHYSVTLYVSVIRKNRFTGVTISGTKNLTETNASYPFTALLTPANASEVPTYTWIIESVGDSDTYDLEVTQAGSTVVRRSDSQVMAVLPNINSRQVNLSTGNYLMSAKNNSTSFTVRCTVRGTYGSEVTASYEVIGHAPFVPRAVQSYDPEEENYNPALIICLKNNEATTGVALHEETFADGSRGFYMTQEEAARITNMGNINVSSIQDSDGYVVESYEDGVLTPKYYTFTDFNSFIFFKNITAMPAYGGNVQYIHIHNRCSNLNNMVNKTAQLKVVKIEENSFFSTIANNLFQNFAGTLYLPKLFSVSYNINHPLYSKVSKVYYGGTISEWMNHASLSYDWYSDFQLYCNDSLVTEIDAELINNAAYKSNISRVNSLVTVNGVVRTLVTNNFRLCKSLQSITLADSITVIPENCFNGCSALVFPSIPSNVTSVGSNAFSNSGAGFSVIPDSVTSFGDQSNMPNITAVSYPNTMNAPGGFINCANLRSVYFRKNVGDEEYYTYTFPNLSGANLTKIGYEEYFFDNSFILLESIRSLRNDRQTLGFPLKTNVFVVARGLTSFAFNWSQREPKYLILDNCRTFSDSRGDMGLNANNNYGSLYLKNISTLDIGLRQACFYVYIWINNTVPPVASNFSGKSPAERIFVPIGCKGTYLEASVWNGFTSYLIEYDFGMDVIGIRTALKESEVDIGNSPLSNCGLSISGGTATITCTDGTFSSAIPIKLRYRINGGTWSDKVNSGATFAVSAGDSIEVYATHQLRAPSNMLRATWDGTSITYSWTNIYIDPENDIDANGVYID